MKKRHLILANGSAACGRNVTAGTWTAHTTSDVSCLNCQAQPEYIEAIEAMRVAQEAAFAAQVPRTVVPQFGRVNDDGVMECPWCQGILWREKPRSLFSYHYVCEGCGKSVHPLTESGMCN